MRPKDPKKWPAWKRRMRRAAKKRVEKRKSDPIAYAKSLENLRKSMAKPEVRQKLSRAARIRWDEDDEWVEKELKRRAGRKDRKAHSEGANRMWEDPQRHIVQSETLLRLWDTPEYATKVVTNMAKALGNLKGMTSLEKKMLSLLRFLGFKYRFVGDGKLVVERFCPDFCHKRFRWLIETYGSYHHTGRDNDKKRLRVFKKNKYKTLVVWDYEFKDIGSLIKKIHLFHARNLGKA